MQIKWIDEYNSERTHTGKYCFGKTPLQTFFESKHLAQEKMLDKFTTDRYHNCQVTHVCQIKYCLGHVNISRRNSASLHRGFIA